MGDMWAGLGWAWLCSEVLGAGLWLPVHVTEVLWGVACGGDGTLCLCVSGLLGALWC